MSRKIKKFRFTDTRVYKRSEYILYGDNKNKDRKTNNVKRRKCI